MISSLTGRHFIQIQDFSREEIILMLETTRELKLEIKRGQFTPYLANKSLGMIFDQGSTRTRISFELGMQQLGGFSLYLKPGEIHLGVKESIYDTAKVLSRFHDAIMIRWNNFEELKEFAQHADIPVVNAMTDVNHPCQALADIYTMMERFGTNLKGMNVTFFGDRTQPAHSLAMICSKLGMNYTHCAPEKYQILPEWSDLFEANNQVSGGVFKQTADIDEATKNAHCIYTDVWYWIGQEKEVDERKEAFAPYQVTMDILKKCDKDVIFEHCLPAGRGVEVTDEVMDSTHSVIFDEAENRMHTEKALLALIMS